METGSHVTDINGQLSSAWFQRGATCLGTALNVNVNINLYSASSQKAPLMRSSLGQHMHIYGLGRASSRPPPPACYVIASSVATSRCPVVDTVVLDHRWRTSLLFVDVARRRWQASSSSVSIVRRRRRSLPWPTAVIVGRCRGKDLIWSTSLARFPVSRSVFLLLPWPTLV